MAGDEKGIKVSVCPWCRTANTELKAIYLDKFITCDTCGTKYPMTGNVMLVPRDKFDMKR